LGKIITHIVDTAFSSHLSATYKLSILIGMDSFAYMVTGPQQELLLLKRIETDGPIGHTNRSINHFFSQLSDTEKDLFLPYNQYRIALSNPAFTIIPTRLFEAEQRMTYIQQVTAIDPKDYEVKSDRLTAIDAHNIYAIPGAMIKQIKQYFPGGIVRHLVTALQEGIWQSKTLQKDKALYINVLGRQIHALLFQDKALKFSNTFQYQSAKDFIYYILLLFDQFELDQKQFPVFLSGHLIEDSEIYRLLRRYLDNFAFIELEQSPFDPAKAQATPPHFHFDILSLVRMD
jgi:hypothetical protein